MTNKWGPQLSFRPELWDENYIGRIEEMSEREQEKLAEIEQAERDIQIQEEYVDDVAKQLKAAKEELKDRVNHLRVLSRPDRQQRLNLGGPE